jgi:hypothetical protein
MKPMRTTTLKMNETKTRFLRPLILIAALGLFLTPMFSSNARAWTWWKGPGWYLFKESFLELEYLEGPFKTEGECRVREKARGPEATAETDFTCVEYNTNNQ